MEKALEILHETLTTRLKMAEDYHQSGKMYLSINNLDRASMYSKWVYEELIKVKECQEAIDELLKLSNQWK